MSKFNKRRRVLTDKEVDALRKRAKAYRDSGGAYLETGYFKIDNKDDKIR